MRIMDKTMPQQNLLDINDDLNLEINNQKIPILEKTESLSFAATDGKLYIIETEQDIADIQKWVVEEKISGYWKIYLDNQYTEDTSLLQGNQDDLLVTRKDVMVNILKLALPITGTMAITITTNYVTGIFLGNISTRLLASMAIIEALDAPLTMICQFTLYPISPLVGRYKEISPTTVGKIVQQGYFIGLIETVPSLLIRYFSKPILLALKQPPSLVGFAESYFRASMWGFPATILVSADEQLLLASNKKLLYVIMSVADLAVTLGLGYVLMNGKLGFPELGIASLGYTSAVRSWLSFIVYKLYFMLDKDFKPYNLFYLSLQNVFSELSIFLRIALPVTLQITSKTSFMFIASMMLGRYGVSTLAAMQVVSRYILFAVQPIHALAIATSIHVGINLGQRNLGSIARYGNMGVLMGLCHTGLLFGISAAIPTFLARPFLDVDDPNNAAIVNLLRPFFIILMGGQMLEAIDITSLGALRGLMDTAAPMLVGIISTWLVAFLLVFAMSNHLGVIPTLACTMTGLALSSVLDWLRWYVLSSQDELEQLVISEESEVTETNNSALVTCIGFFKPKMYTTVPMIKEIGEESQLSLREENTQLNEEEHVQLTTEELDISEEESKRCGCVLF